MNRSRIIKISVCLVFALLILSSFYDILLNNQPETAQAVSNRTILSQMSEEECIEFIEENNIEIPNDFSSSLQLGKFIKDTISIVESNPSYEFVYSYSVTQSFAEDIKDLVNDYYGIDQDGQYLTYSLNSYTLTDSTLYCNEGWLNYNCYAYAIERTENPAEYETGRQYQPGDFSNESFSLGLTLYQMVLVVKSDLETLGYENVQIHNTRPNIASYEKLICMRRGPDDYHFMKYDYASGAWYHKPGLTAILKYNYEPSIDRVWTDECIDINGIAFPPRTIYTGEIYYISYSPFITNITNNEITITDLHQSVVLPTELEIPATMEFNDNSYLVTKIGDQAFMNCSGLKNISIPASVTSIGINAFLDCTNLQSVTFATNSQLTNIGYRAFLNCDRLTSVSIPASVTTIGDRAFKDSENLEKVVIYKQSGVVSIGTECFAGTSSNLKICVPNSLFNSYKTATNWSGYASKLEGYYIENGQPYILQTYTVSAADYIECNTICQTETGEGTFLTGVAIVAHDLRYYYAECILDYDLGEVVDCSLKIEVYAGGTGCYLLDSDKCVITWCSVEDYILTVPFMEIYNYCEGEFYLFPEEDCEENIEFAAQDVSIEYVAKVNI